MLRKLLFLLVALMARPALAGPGDALMFHPNGGQWPAQVLYRTGVPGGALFVERAGFTYLQQQGGAWSVHGRPDLQPLPDKAHVYRMRFEGGYATSTEGVDPFPHYVNYFIGNDPAKWATGLPVFPEVRLRGVYPGIDLRVDGRERMKYDWVVAPGADPEKIILRLEGHEGASVQNGALHITTSLGTVVELPPVAWQVVNGIQKPVRCTYALSGDIVRYKLGRSYDPRYELVIDPEVVFASYTGSHADNFGFTATYDAAGHLYGGGLARGSGYPVTSGVVQPNYMGGLLHCDMAISKFTADGTDLLWSTYLGGSGSEVPHSMVVNQAEELFVLGSTSSANYPLTTGCYDQLFNGGPEPAFPGSSYGVLQSAGTDAVVTRFNSGATQLLGSTYLGGSLNDGLNEFPPTNHNYGDPFRGEIVLDALERPVLVTTTSSAGLPTSDNAEQTGPSGSGDAYICRMDPGLTTVQWGTYYGGSGVDAGYGLQIATGGDIYVTGGTTSADLPMHGGGVANALAGGVDGFIARFDPVTAQLVASTYIGTAAYDQTYFVQLDPVGAVFVVGQSSGNYPVSAGRYANPAASQFIHKFTADLSASLWSTRVGGNGTENMSPSAFLVDVCGRIYVSGWAGSTNLVGEGVAISSTTSLTVTPDAYQHNTDGSDFYLVVLEAEATARLYASYFGGTSAEHVDGGTSRFDKNGVVYQAVCAGCGGSSTFPTTPGAWSQVNNSPNCNLGVFKIDFQLFINAAIELAATGAQICTGDTMVFQATGNAEQWVWDFGDGSATAEGVEQGHAYDTPGTYLVTLVGHNGNVCTATDTAFMKVIVGMSTPIDPAFGITEHSDCTGTQVVFEDESVGGDGYHWQFGDGTFGSGSSASHTYTVPGSYVITLGVIDQACGDTTFVQHTIEVEPAVLVLPEFPPVVLCLEEAVELSVPGGYDSYQWSTGAQTPAITVLQPGSYWVTVTDGLCIARDTMVVIGQSAPIRMVDALSCAGRTVRLVTSPGLTSIEWSDGSTGGELPVTASGTYWYSAMDPLGCVVRDTVEVEMMAVFNADTDVPNVFSPNGDGRNETFRVHFPELGAFSMEVFNRWGQLLYGTNDPLRGWNGGVENGQDKVPDGTYFYVIKLRDLCSDGPEAVHTGHVTLLR